MPTAREAMDEVLQFDLPIMPYLGWAHSARRMGSMERDLPLSETTVVLAEPPKPLPRPQIW